MKVRTLRFFEIVSRQVLAAAAFFVFTLALGNSHAAAENKPELQQQCESGEAKSCFDLGMLERDQGKAEEAKQWLRLACEKDYARACFRLGSLELELGNSAEGKRLMNTACLKEVAAACSRLAIFARDAKNDQEAKRYDQLACDKGSYPDNTDRAIAAEACFRLRDTHRNAGNSDRAQQAFEKGCVLLKQNCDAGQLLACSMLKNEEQNEKKRSLSASGK